VMDSILVVSLKCWQIAFYKSARFLSRTLLMLMLKIDIRILYFLGLIGATINARTNGNWSTFSIQKELILMNMQRFEDPLAKINQHFQSGPSRLALIFVHFQFSSISFVCKSDWGPDPEDARPLWTLFFGFTQLSSTRVTTLGYVPNVSRVNDLQNHKLNQ